MSEWNALNRIYDFLKRFVVLPNEEDYYLVSLWILHTYFSHRLTTTPRLALISPEYGCGKTRTLEVIASLSFQSESLDGYSKSYLMRRVTEIKEEFGRPPTFCIDEVDTVWNGSKSDEGSETLRMFMNSGYRVGKYIGITDGEGKSRKPTRFETFAPVVFAGKGDKAPESVKSRSIEITLQKRLSYQEIEDFHTKAVAFEIEEIKEFLNDWVERKVDEILFENESVPYDIRDRERELWLPLYAVSRLCGWEEQFKKTLLLHTRQKSENETPTDRRYLEDCLRVFSEAGNPETIRTKTLVVSLNDLPDTDYASKRYGRGLDDRLLAKKLKGYGIKPIQIRFGEETAKGYYREPITKALARYSQEVSTPLPESETEETEETLL
jgi:hypothetical protein